MNTTTVQIPEKLSDWAEIGLKHMDDVWYGRVPGVQLNMAVFLLERNGSCEVCYGGAALIGLLGKEEAIADWNGGQFYLADCLDDIRNGNLRRAVAAWNRFEQPGVIRAHTSDGAEAERNALFKASIGCSSLDTPGTEQEYVEMRNELKRRIGILRKLGY